MNDRILLRWHPLALALLLASPATLAQVPGTPPTKAHHDQEHGSKPPAEEREQDDHDYDDHSDDDDHADEHGHDHHHGHGQTLDTVVVQSTRSRRRVADEPIRVDVIDREEIEEKLLMTPGNISMLVAETAGVRVQSTAPAMGASNIRIQGLRGRYTQLLADGLPLYGGQASSFGLLQIPPTDLGRVEIIKGSASALHGPAALGGVINLISRRPGDEAESEVLLNMTAREGFDATGYTALPLSSDWGMSVTAGVHGQRKQDLDGEGWADIPGHQRWTLRPRLFWHADSGANALLTFGAMQETRTGGTLGAAVLPDGAPFPLAQDTRRHDAGAVIELPVREGDSLHLRLSGMRTTHGHQFGSVHEDDRHETAFAEVAWAATAGDTNWLAGAAVQSDRFASRTFADFDYRYSVPAVFAQADRLLSEHLTLAGSARWDAHSEYGRHFSPRLSLLYRDGPWTLRTSLGRGFHAPTPFVEEIEATGLARLEPLQGLVVERATTASLDIGRTQGAWETHLSLFASRINDAVRLVDAAPDPDGLPRVRLSNIDGSTRTHGAELLLRWRWEDFIVTGNYVFTHATEPHGAGAGRRPVPLTPRHTAGLVAMWEQHGRGRIGLEAYYTGTQWLDDNPYRQRGRPYVELGALGELDFGRFSVFLNLENLLNVRQTRYHRMTLPRRAADGRWTVDAWAPTEGLVANGGVRLRF